MLTGTRLGTSCCWQPVDPNQHLLQNLRTTPSVTDNVSVDQVQKLQPKPMHCVVSKDNQSSYRAGQCHADLAHPALRCKQHACIHALTQEGLTRLTAPGPPETTQPFKSVLLHDPQTCIFVVIPLPTSKETCMFCSFALVMASSKSAVQGLNSERCRRFRCYVADAAETRPAVQQGDCVQVLATFTTTPEGQTSTHCLWRREEGRRPQAEWEGQGVGRQEVRNILEKD
jgi:hypothetical protein